MNIKNKWKTLVAHIIIKNENEINSNDTVYNCIGTKLTKSKVPELISLK